MVIWQQKGTRHRCNQEQRWLTMPLNPFMCHPRVNLPSSWIDICVCPLTSA